MENILQKKKYYKNNQYSYLCEQNCFFNSFNFNNRILTCNCSMTPLNQTTNIETNNECLIKLDKKILLIIMKHII